MNINNYKHLCDNCIYDFATCKHKKIIFGIDILPELVNEDADKVIFCDGFIKNVGKIDYNGIFSCLKKALNVSSDYCLSQKIGITKSYYSELKNNKKGLSLNKFKEIMNKFDDDVKLYVIIKYIL